MRRVRDLNGIAIWGEHDQDTISQIVRCASDRRVAGAALMADGHKGYSQPIGGVVAYRNAVSPSGVGYDIGCGNKAVRTPLFFDDIRADLGRILDEIAARISFGIGRKNNEPVDHSVLHSPLWREVPYLESLHKLASDQLGTVGAGNHYCDIFREPATGRVWVGVHFGSRGFGHRVASGFINLAAGRPFDGKAPGESMDQPPAVLDLDTALGQDYLAAMTLAGQYAYAGRDLVVEKILHILGTRADLEVHNHHNYAWEEVHNGERVYVVRKGATPCWPGQRGFVGGSMGDMAVIIEGVQSDEGARSFYSAVHGAGRLISRTRAAGRLERRRGPGGKKVLVRVGGAITEEMMHEWLRAAGVQLRGGATDEAPQVYRPLREVLDAHTNHIRVLHTLMPVGVVMAGPDEYDPYKD